MSQNSKKLGYLRKEDNQPRAISPTNETKNIQIPLLGIIAAGEPIEAIEISETIEIPLSQLSKSGKHYALRVNGNSMIDEGIYAKDIVVIRKQPTAENGETVVALINNNEVTLKKIYKEKNRIRLQPANPNIPPIYTKEIVIQGKVVSVIRNFTQDKNIKQFITDIKLQKENIPKSDDIKKYLNKVFREDIMSLLKKLPDKSWDNLFYLLKSKIMFK